MDVAVLSVGRELVSGQSVDTNSAWISAELAAVGARVRFHLTVDDDRREIAAAIRWAAGQVDWVLATGGLGPTLDDLTRQGVADAASVSLVRHPECVKQIEDFFARMSRTMSESNLTQADLPVGATPIENTCGTAPGFRFDIGSCKIVCMPGVPAEMREMFRRGVLAELKAIAGGSVTVIRVLHTFGEGESVVGERIADLMSPELNPSVGTTAKDAIIALRIVSRASTAAEAETAADRVAAELRRRLGSLIFGEGDETLATAVGKLLRRQRATAATAESCTGGLVAKLLTDVPGSSDYFREGRVTYANDAKVDLLGVAPELLQRCGAVSAEVAEAMAVGCRVRSGVAYALAATGIAGPAGGSEKKPVGLVYLGLSDSAGCATRRLLLGGHLSREQIRIRTAYAALNLLRKRLLGE